MSLPVVVGDGDVVVGDGVVQRRVQRVRRLVALLPQQLAGVQRGGRRGRQVQQGRGRAAAVPVRHAAPLLHGAGRAARADAAHARVGARVRIARAHYHTVVLLGGHGAANTIRARTHFTTTVRTLGFHFLYALIFLTDLHITTCTNTLCSTWNNIKTFNIKTKLPENQNVASSIKLNYVNINQHLFRWYADWRQHFSMLMRARLDGGQYWPIHTTPTDLQKCVMCWHRRAQNEA